MARSLQPEHTQVTFSIYTSDSCHAIGFPLINQQGYVMGCWLLFRAEREQNRAIFTASLKVGEPQCSPSEPVYGRQIFPCLTAWEQKQLLKNPQLSIEGLPEEDYLEKVLPLIEQVWGVKPRVNRLPIVVQGGSDDF